MPEELKKFQDQVNALKKEFSSFEDKYGEPEKLGNAELKEAEEHLKEITRECNRLLGQTSHPIRNSVKYHSEQIEVALGKIEKGVNATGDIEYALKALKEIFEPFEEAREDLKRLSEDIDSMDMK